MDISFGMKNVTKHLEIHLIMYEAYIYMSYFFVWEVVALVYKGFILSIGPRASVFVLLLIAR